MSARLTQDDASLGNSIVVLSGFPFPSAEFTTRDGKPLIRIRDLVTGKTETNFRSSFDPSYLIQRGDILIGMDGDFNVLRWLGPEALLNQRVCKVSTNSPEIDWQFLYWWLKPHVEAIHRRTPQTTVRHLSVGDVYGIPKPPLQSDAQRFAAAVLDTVDEAIAKLKEVRAGLLHDLLTCGLDENGELRDPIAHPEQFKDSPLGRIPKEWTVAALLYFVPTAEYGISSSLGDSGLPVLRMNNISEGEADLADLKFSSLPVPETLFLKPLDVLFNRTNSWEHVGRTGIWRGQIDRATFASYLVRLVPRPDRLIPEMLNLWLNWPPIQLAMRRFATPAVQQVNINPTNLRMLTAAFPNGLGEQQRNVSKVQGCDDSLRATRAELLKLQRLKSGLMTDLLTGRVRVPENIMDGGGDT